MKLDFGLGTKHAARLVNGMLWSVIMLAFTVMGVRWLAHYFDSILVAIAITGLAIVSIASLLSEGPLPHRPH